jgi:hypothetical protein
MEQELKLMRALRFPAAKVQKLEDHINDVENVATGLGFARLRNRKGERNGIGQQMPSATDMIKRMLDEEKAYRLLSAVAHGHVWAIQQLGFTQGDVNLTNGISTTALTKHSGTVEGYGFLVTRVMKSLGLPLWNQCLYYGWDMDRLNALLESVYDQLDGSPAIRFWRPKTGRFEGG